MTTAQFLAGIERVDPRSVWPNEAQDFTPWLAAHIDELGEALRLDLELQSEEAEEAPVAPDSGPGETFAELASTLTSAR
jgi:hypothetical protein